MKLDINEQKILFTFGCPVYENTVSRLAMGAAMITDEYARRRVIKLRDRLVNEASPDNYPELYIKARKDVNRYFDLKARYAMLKKDMEQHLIECGKDPLDAEKVIYHTLINEEKRKKKRRADISRKGRKTKHGINKV